MLLKGMEERGAVTKGELNNHEGDLHRADMVHIPDRARTRRPSGRGDTHICLDKQLPCLYPFPQRSQRMAVEARFPSVLSWAPSLARRFRFLGLPSEWSDPGEPLRATGDSWLGLLMLRER